MIKFCEYFELIKESKCSLKKAPSIDYDPKELAMGIKVEMEHTTDTDVAETIAKQHLAEDPKYYSKLKKFHKD
jgi:hypothetical protein